MLITEILNEYELDVVESILDNKQLHMGLLKEKRIVCLGSGSKSLARTVICTFLVLNDKYQANNTIYYVDLNRTENQEAKLLKGLTEREDVHVVKLEELSNLSEITYCIDFGFCNQKFSLKELEERKTLLSKTLEIVTIGAIKRYILLSDYRAYNDVPPNILVAENEYIPSDNPSSIREYENQCVEKMNSCQISYQVLRSAIVLGGDLTSHPIHAMLQRCGKGERVTLPLNSDKYTFVYLTDLLGALFYTLQLNKKNEIYNVTGKQSTVTTFEMGRILSENLTEDCLSFESVVTKDLYPIALDSAKLRMEGYEGQVSFYDAFEIALKEHIGKEPFFLFHDTYNGKLKVIQKLMLQVILEIDTICKRHNIHYFLGGGTLLGAIRHKGFIPWDDDADIMMLRKDYEKFVEVAEKELPEYLKLQIPKTDKHNHFFSKVRVQNTVCATEFTRKLSDLDVGFFVDIFAHDYTANSKFGQRLHEKLTILARSLVYNKWGATYVKGDGSHKVYRLLATVIKTILPMRYLEWQQFKIIEFFAHKKNRKYLYDGMGQNLRKGPFPKEWLEEVIYVPFESVMLPVPKEYDKYLKHLYGDYMQMVGVAKRKNSHTIYIMDLGQYMNSMKKNSIQE